MRLTRMFFWLLLGMLLAQLLCLFVPPVSGASLSLGGGQVSPHSYDGSYGLDKGWHFSATAEDLYYESVKWPGWDINVGILYMVSRYERRENPPNQGRSSQDSHIAAIYTKPGLYLTERLKPFILAGAGVNFADGTHPCGMAGGGFRWQIDEDWSLEGMYLFVWDTVKVYRAPSLSVRYDF